MSSAAQGREDRPEGRTRVPKAIAHAVLIAGLALSLVTRAAASLTPATTRAQPDLAAIFSQFHDTLNGGDVTAALAFFTDDGTFEAAGMTFSGQALQKNFEAQVSQNRQVDIISTQVSGNTLTASVEVRAKQITACGAQRVVGTETATFSGDKISSLIFQDDPSDSQTATVLACVEALGLPAAGGEPPAAAGGGLPLALLLGGAVLAAGALVTTVVVRRRP